MKCCAFRLLLRNQEYICPAGSVISLIVESGAIAIALSYLQAILNGNPEDREEREEREETEDNGPPRLFLDCLTPRRRGEHPKGNDATSTSSASAHEDQVLLGVMTPQGDEFSPPCSNAVSTSSASPPREDRVELGVMARGDYASAREDEVARRVADQTRTRQGDASALEDEAARRVAD